MGQFQMALSPTAINKCVQPVMMPVSLGRTPVGDRLFHALPIKRAAPRLHHPRLKQHDTSICAATITSSMSATVDKSLLSQHGVGDAHCHAQDDQARCNLVPSLSARYIAVMGTRADDWGAVEELQRLAPDKVPVCTCGGKQHTLPLQDSHRETERPMIFQGLRKPISKIYRMSV